LLHLRQWLVEKNGFKSPWLARAHPMARPELNPQGGLKNLCPKNRMRYSADKFLSRHGNPEAWPYNKTVVCSGN